VSRALQAKYIIYGFREKESRSIVTTNQRFRSYQPLHTFPVAAKSQCHIAPALLFTFYTVLTRFRPEYP